MNGSPMVLFEDVSFYDQNVCASYNVYDTFILAKVEQETIVSYKYFRSVVSIRITRSQNNRTLSVIQEKVTVKLPWIRVWRLVNVYYRASVGIKCTVYEGSVR